MEVTLTATVSMKYTIKNPSEIPSIQESFLDSPVGMLIDGKVIISQ